MAILRAPHSFAPKPARGPAGRFTALAATLVAMQLGLQCARAASSVGIAEARGALASRIRQITSRPEYRHATFGVEVYSLDADRPVYALHGQELFTPASTIKLLTEGTALELLGANYRFHTRIYRTGAVSPDGTLRGDLVLVASGDPNLSNRVQPDGKLAFENEDHSYGGTPRAKALPGDPLQVIRELAEQVAARGIKRVAGRVLVDVSLFPEGDREFSVLTVSPIAINDNIVDVSVSSGSAAGRSVAVTVSPRTPYVTFVDRATTGPPGSRRRINFKEMANPDGTRTVTLTGVFPLGAAAVLYDYEVPQPSRFAQVALVGALRASGVAADLPPARERADFAMLRAAYTPARMVAEHISPPLSQDIKVTLKSSLNLHASMMPYVLGAVLGREGESAGRAGFELERKFLAAAGLDPSEASQSDGAGGAAADYLTPDFIVRYLVFMSKQKDFDLFERALPILGRDGTLASVERGSPAAGHVYAKTGMIGVQDALNSSPMIYGAGLAGYMVTKEGRHLAFAVYVNRVSLPRRDSQSVRGLTEVLGRIATIIYSTPLGGRRARAATKPRVDGHPAVPLGRTFHRSSLAPISDHAVAPKWRPVSRRRPRGFASGRAPAPEAARDLRGKWKGTCDLFRCSCI
jgi:PBP4 family serine-type D-alanyl-D-alanine carboxypeptidase